MKIDYTLALDTVKRSIAKLTGANFEELGLDTNVYTIGHGFDTSVLAKELEYKFEVKISEDDLKKAVTVHELFDVVMSYYQECVDSSNEELRNRILNIIAETLDVEKESLTDATEFSSLTSDMSELQEALENEFQINLELDMEDMKTVMDAIYLIDEQLQFMS